jgi:hypothetical protein
MRGWRKRIDLEAKADRVLAFNTAALTRAKKLPAPREFIGGAENKARGPAAMAMLRAHAARLPRKSWDQWQKH